MNDITPVFIYYIFLTVKDDLKVEIKQEIKEENGDEKADRPPLKMIIKKEPKTEGLKTENLSEVRLLKFYCV